MDFGSKVSYAPNRCEDKSRGSALRNRDETGPYICEIQLEGRDNASGYSSGDSLRQGISNCGVAILVVHRDRQYMERWRQGVMGRHLARLRRVGEFRYGQ